MWTFFGVLLVVFGAGFPAFLPTGLRPIFDPRIVGGKQINITEVPYMVAVVYYGAQYCGGSIISDVVVMTAAHCTPGITERRTKIRVGTSYRSGGGELLPIKKILPHENYEHYLEGNDIALIWMESPLVFTDTVQPVNLPALDFSLDAGVVARVTGWGYLTTNGPSSEQLMAVDVPIVDRDVCYEAFRAWVNIDMICAGFTAGGKDACQMDSGGPLVVNDTVMGIVSWGNGCATPNYYGVYTNVAHFRDWIEDKLENSTWIIHN